MANERNFSTALGKITQIDPSRPRGDSITYIWQVYYEEAKRYFDCTEEFLYSKDGPFSKHVRPEFVEVILFENADHFIYQLPYFEEYFSTAFRLGGMSVGKRYRNFYYRLVISKTEFDKLHALIQTAGLGKIEGLLLEIVVLAQELATRMRSNTDYPETHNQIQSVKGDIDKLIQVIENTLFDDQLWFRSMIINSIQKLHSIKFIFESREPIQIQNKWLTEEMIRIIRNHYDDMSYKYWRLELMALPDIFEKLSTQSKFGKLLAQSYYDFLIKERFVTVESPYPNKLMSFITNLLSSSYLYSDSMEEDKTANEIKIRNWIKRRIESPLIHIHPADLPDLDLLNKYFDSRFIAMGDPKDYESANGTAKFICTRFNLPKDLTPEIMHLSACIIAANRIIGFQFTNTSSDDIKVTEFQSLRALLREISVGRKIASINITMDKDGGTHEFKNRMPLYLIEQAIQHYYETNNIEFESNIIHTQVEMDIDSEFPILNQDRFNLPYERFFVRLTHSLFNYLDEFSETYFRPDERYIEIIAALYQENGVFRNGSEQFLFDKVSDWYHLDAES